MKSTLVRILVGLAATLLTSAAALAQSGGSYNLNWTTIDGGGSPSAGSSFSLNGTIGQPDAGAMTGGSFAVSGGFWPGITGIGVEPRPGLSIRVGNAKTVILTWPNPSTGYVLQQTANMNAPGGGWTEVTQPSVLVGPNKEVTLPATGQVCFFRLRRE